MPRRAFLTGQPAIRREVAGDLEAHQNMGSCCGSGRNLELVYRYDAADQAQAALDAQTHGENASARRQWRALFKRRL
jgi:hypothetical protein